MEQSEGQGAREDACRKGPEMCQLKIPKTIKKRDVALEEDLGEGILYEYPLYEMREEEKPSRE